MRSSTAPDAVPSGGRGPHGSMLLRRLAVVVTVVAVLVGMGGVSVSFSHGVSFDGFSPAMADPAPAGADDSFSVVDTVLGLSGPVGVAVSPDGSRVYVADYGGVSVSVIDASNNTVVATVTDLSQPAGVAVSPDGSRVYVANYGGGSVIVIDTSNNTVVATVTVGTNPFGVAVSPDGSRVYVTNAGGGSVSVIDTSNNTVVATVTVGTQPYLLAVSPDGSRVYVPNVSDITVSVIDTSNNTVVATVADIFYPAGAAVSPDGSRVYVTSLFGNTVGVIDTSNNTVVATVAGLDLPFGVAVSPDGSRVYVANFSGSVIVIDTSNNSVVATVTVENGTSGVAVSPDGSLVYVTNQGAGSVSVISSLPATKPSAPTALVATPGDGSASIAFTPGANGGAAITKYQYKVGNGSWTDAVGTTSPITVTGLTNYQTANIRLRAVNAAGAGSASVAVTARPQLAGPTIGVAYSSGKRGAFVGFGFTRPVGSTLVGFTVRAYAKGTTTVVSSCQTAPSGRSCYIPSLTSGTEYDIRVQAYFTLAGETKVRSSFESATSRVRVNS